MLITCPECGLQLSDKAFACPHCGYPMRKGSKPVTSRRKRLPNGFGQISKLNQNLRKPFRVMVTVGKNEYGRPICKLLKPEAYFETYNDAYKALMEYNKNPYDLADTTTLEDLYPKWIASKDVSESRLKVYNSSWKYCDTIKNVLVRDIRIHHIRACVEQSNAPSTMRVMIKNVLAGLLDYAMQYELTDRNYARTYKVPTEITKDAVTVKNEHKAFTDDEMKYLFDHVSENPIFEMVLYQCYSGWRPNELLNIKIDDINLEEGWIKGGSKTEAGKNRIVPIHSKIAPIINKYYDESKTYLFEKDGHLYPYKRFLKKYEALIPEHRPHDGRKQFVTMAKAAHMDEYALKRIVGHTISDITEKVYTERPISWLKEEMEKIG